MSSTPQFIKEGWKQHGPGKCRCPNCGSICSTNAMARARHVCPPKPEPPRAPPEISATTLVAAVRSAIRRPKRDG